MICYSLRGSVREDFGGIYSRKLESIAIITLPEGKALLFSDSQKER